MGAAVGGISGHLWRGMSRHDIKEFGQVIDAAVREAAAEVN